MVAKRMMELMDRTAQTITALTIMLCMAVLWGIGVLVTLFITCGWILIIFVIIIVFILTILFI